MVVNLNPNIMFSAKMLIKEGIDSKKTEFIIASQVFISVFELTKNQGT